MLRTTLLLQALFLTVVVTAESDLKISSSLEIVSSSEQNLPCTLFQMEVDFEDGTDGSEWICEVSGPDASNAGSKKKKTHVRVDGIENVLGHQSELKSGKTTVLVKGGKLKNKKLKVGKNDQITFGEVNTTTFGEADDRRLSRYTGDLKVLVVKVTTADASLTKTQAEISGDVFGTNGSGDTVNLKSMMEDCSINQATISGGDGTGSSCTDDPDAIFDVPRNDASVDAYNCDFFNNWQFDEPGDLCFTYGDDPQVDDPNESANTRCCVCGGGDIINYDNDVVDGVMELTLNNINAVGSTGFDIEAAAVEELESLFYVDDLKEKFDNVMLCLPKGSHWSDSDTSKTNWVAYGYIGGYLTVFNGDKWCANELTQLHELGHNWALQHASEGNGEYDDQTGVMGYTIGAADDATYGNKMCFNGAHSWQLGWYTSYNLEMDPLTATLCGTLVGVDRLPAVSSDENFVVKLTNSVEDYYIMYNHAVGANEGTTEAANLVTITTKMTDINAKTFLVAKLGQGQSATFSNWDGSGQTVTVTVTSITTDASTGNAQIEISSTSTGPVSCVPPTSGPTSGPTSAPVTSGNPGKISDLPGPTGSKGDPHCE